jgi:hypothetical protein
MEGAMRRLLALTVLLVAAVIPAPVSAADPAVTVSVDRVTLVNRTFVDVDVSFSCRSPRATANRHVEFDGPAIYVDIIQSAGSRIAAGGAWVWFDGARCDGTVQTLQASVMVDPYTRPFKAGRAMVAAGIDASYYWWNERTGRDGYVDQWVEMPWAPIRIQR